MNTQLRRIFESDLKNAHRDNEELILRRNAMALQVEDLNNKIAANVEYMRMIREILTKNYDLTP